MRMFKRTAAALLAVAMSVGALAGCSAKDGATSSDKFLIGGTGPLTGAAAIYGKAVQNGASLAVEEINAAGGVNGMMLEFNMQDDEHNAEKALNAYNKLKDDGIKAFMGTVTSAPCLAVTEVATQDNMFLLTPSGSAVDCTKGDNAFRVCFKDPDQGKASAQYISENKLAKKVAVIYDSSDVYSTGIYQSFKEESSKVGLDIVTEQVFTSSNNTDFSVAIQQIKSSDAELVFLPIYYQQAALIITQADKAGLSTKYFGCDGLDGLIDQLADAKDLANGIMLLTPFAADSKDAKSQAFTKAYEAKFSETPNQFAADAYDAIYAIKAALEKSGISDPNKSYSEVCDALKVAMTQIEVAGVTGNITWDASGEPTKDPKAMVIKDGAYSAMD